MPLNPGRVSDRGAGWRLWSGVRWNLEQHELREDLDDVTGFPRRSDNHPAALALTAQLCLASCVPEHWHADTS